MRAAFITSLGDAVSITVGELPVPVPGPTDVLVEVRAVAVNKVDTFIRSGAYKTPIPFPYAVGRDLTGIVRGYAGGFTEGQRVWCNSMGHAGRQGATAEFVAVPADRLYPLPDGVSFEEAVAVLHPAATAYLALFRHGAVGPGDTVLVAGAAGAVGSALTVLAHEAGARVIATARAADFEYCLSLGAGEVRDYSDPGWTDGLGGVDVFVDTYGNNDVDLALDLLVPGGRIVVVAGMASRPVVPVAKLFLRDCSIRGFVISRATSADLAAAARTINRLLAAGKLRPRRLETMPLSGTAQAHQRVEEGTMSGTRLVILPG